MYTRDYDNPARIATSPLQLRHLHMCTGTAAQPHVALECMYGMHRKAKSETRTEDVGACSCRY